MDSCWGGIRLYSVSKDPILTRFYSHSSHTRALESPLVPQADVLRARSAGGDVRFGGDLPFFAIADLGAAVAAAKQCSVAEVEAATWATAARFYGLDGPRD